MTTPDRTPSEKLVHNVCAMLTNTSDLLTAYAELLDLVGLIHDAERIRTVKADLDFTLKEMLVRDYTG